MTFRAYTWGMFLLSLLSLLAFGGVLYYVDPDKSGWPGKAIFYLVFIFVLSSFLNLLLLLLRKKMLGSEAVLENIGLSLRQGFLLAVLSAGILILQSQRMLVWWDGLLLVAGVFLVELYFLSRE